MEDYRSSSVLCTADPAGIAVVSDDLAGITVFPRVVGTFPGLFPASILVFF